MWAIKDIDWNCWKNQRDSTEENLFPYFMHHTHKLATLIKMSISNLHTHNVKENTKLFGFGPLTIKNQIY